MRKPKEKRFFVNSFVTPDAPNDIFTKPPSQFARLIAATNGSEGGWLPVEFDAVLRHQLDAPLRTAGRQPPESATSAADIRTFRELFQHPQPPLGLLKQTKDFAKAHREHTNSPLPHDVATVLYYASIVAARVRLGERITSLDDAALRQGIAWGVALPWLDEGLRALFDEGLRVLQK